MILCPDLYVYHDDVKRDTIIKQFTIFLHSTYGIIVQVPKKKENITQYRIKYYGIKPLGMGTILTNDEQNFLVPNPQKCFK